MDKFAYGLIITIVGMGGTLFSLMVLIWAIQIMKRFFPYREEEEQKGKEVV
jgi:Na+-transporting methylmalonyl-CoA/oxaloacetate decarboxylase gamma subunit